MDIVVDVTVAKATKVTKAIKVTKVTKVTKATKAVMAAKVGLSPSPSLVLNTENVLAVFDRRYEENDVNEVGHNVSLNVLVRHESILEVTYDRSKDDI